MQLYDKDLLSVQEVRDLVEKAKKAQQEFAQKSLDTLMELADVVGLLQQEEENDIDDDVQALVEERQEARKAKNFARADEIRDILKARGITLKDTPQGVQIIKD